MAEASKLWSPEAAARWRHSASCEETLRPEPDTNEGDRDQKGRKNLQAQHLVGTRRRWRGAAQGRGKTGGQGEEPEAASTYSAGDPTRPDNLWDGANPQAGTGPAEDQAGTRIRLRSGFQQLRDFGVPGAVLGCSGGLAAMEQTGPLQILEVDLELQTAACVAPCAIAVPVRSW